MEQDGGAISSARSVKCLYSPEEFLNLLDSSIIKSSKGSAMSAVHSIGGRVRDGKFVLTRLASFKNGFARDLHGAVLPGDNGSEIVYRFELNMVVRIMFSLWFILVTVLLGAGILSVFTPQVRLELIAGPLLMLAGGIFLINFAMEKGKQEESQLEAFLLRLVDSKNFNASAPQIHPGQIEESFPANYNGSDFDGSNSHHGGNNIG